jgi:diguanylate cyclase (GGDEF)-like protein
MQVLVADDDRTIRMLVENVLNLSGYQVITAINGEEAWDIMQGNNSPRMAVLDWEMPGMSGLELCRRIRESESNKTRYTYILLLTARNQKNDLIIGMQAGADDYVTKPFNPHELNVRMRAGQRIVELQIELFNMKEEFRRLSRTDPLTGCYNRRAILERLHAELARAARDGKPLGVGIFDIDHFKAINDMNGHSYGDSALCEFVRRLEKGIRISDMYGRVGGEEFLVLWPAADMTGVTAAAERIRALIGGNPFRLDEKEVQVTVSIGVTITEGHETPESVMTRADNALYSAKEKGRNRVEVQA